LAEVLGETVSTLNPVVARNVASQSVVLMSARSTVVATAVVAVVRMVVVAVVAGEVEVDGRVVVKLNGGSVTVDVFSPPPHPAASATVATSDAARVVARLACMPAQYGAYEVGCVT
jgi:hypothetical protein